MASEVGSFSKTGRNTRGVLQVEITSTKWPPCWLHDQMPAPGFRGHRMPRVYYDISSIVSLNLALLCDQGKKLQTKTGKENDRGQLIVLFLPEAALGCRTHHSRWVYVINAKERKKDTELKVGLANLRASIN